MAERDMRTRVTRALSSLHAISVENPVLPGTPDVNYVEGWLELKWLREWPASGGTPVRFNHWTPQQKVWHLLRRKAGGQCWVLIQCKREWILLAGEVAALHLHDVTRGQLYELATHRWPDGLNEKELRDCVSQGQSAFSLSAADLEKVRSKPRGGTGSA
jgi:hypothetical protein